MADDDEVEIIEIEERRDLRLKYRELRDVLNEKSRELSTIGDKEFIILHDQTSGLFGKVKHIRELAIDAQTLNDFSRGVRNQGTKLSDVSSNFSFEQFAEGLLRRYTDDGSRHFSWAKLGHDCGGLFAAVPNYSVLLGPLSRVIKGRKQVHRKGADNDQAIVRPQEIALANGNGEDGTVEEATNQRCMRLFQELQEQSEKGDVNLIDVLFDPSDVIQTIENLFDYSFLVKDKRTELDIDEEEGTMMGKIVNPLQFAEDCPKRQLVLAINMKELKDLTGALNSTNGQKRPISALHRDDPLYTAQSVQQQADLIEARGQAKLQRSLKKAKK